MNEERKLKLMSEAIEQARMCVPTDSRLHPRVGAVLADAQGKVLCAAHRNEQDCEGHAEFLLLEKAKRSGIDPKGAVLFSSLEPCTRRGIGKVPCAVRIAESGISRVYIGTLDPNPHITGRGAMFLSTMMEVEHFPLALNRELTELNRDFFNHYIHHHVPAVSVYAGSASTAGDSAFRPILAGQREGLLQQSLDLISGTSGQVLMFAGDLSWLRELQVTVAIAKLAGRSIRILCGRKESRSGDFERFQRIAASLGADVGISNSRIDVRGTLVSPGGEQAAMICVERRPALHGLLLQAPHESSILDGLSTIFRVMLARIGQDTFRDTSVPVNTTRRYHQRTSAVCPGLFQRVY